MAEDGAVDAAIKLAEQLQAPVCTTYLHNDAFPKSHPLLMGPLGYQVIMNKIIGIHYKVWIIKSGKTKYFMISKKFIILIQLSSYYSQAILPSHEVIVFTKFH